MHRIRHYDNLFNTSEIAAIMNSTGETKIKYRLVCLKADGTKILGDLAMLKSETLEPLRRSLSRRFPSRKYYIVPIMETKDGRILELIA